MAFKRSTRAAPGACFRQGQNIWICREPEPVEDIFLNPYKWELRPIEAAQIPTSVLVRYLPPSATRCRKDGSYIQQSPAQGLNLRRIMLKGQLRMAINTLNRIGHEVPRARTPVSGIETFMLNAIEADYQVALKRLKESSKN